MKKILLLFVFLCSVITLYAQEGQRLVKTGLSSGQQWLTIGIVLGLILTGWGLIRLQKTLTKFRVAKQKAKEDSEKKVIPPKLGDYELLFDRNSFNDSCYYSLLNDKLQVKIISPKSNENEKAVILATSFAHGITEDDVKILRGCVLEIAKVNFKKSHELVITMSRAVDFSNFQNFILKFLFTCLDTKYRWMYEEQKIYVEKKNELFQEFVTISMNSEAFYYWRLSELLQEINQVDRITCGTDTKHRIANLDIHIFKKDGLYSHTELLSEIERVFRKHIAVGVKFIEKS